MKSSRPIEFARGTLGEHNHICAFFHSAEEERRVLRSFVTDGFACGDKGCHIVGPHEREEHLAWLTSEGIDVGSTLESGQLEVRRWEEAYLRGGHFEQDAMIALLEKALQSGKSAGYGRTRLVAHMEWALLDVPGADDLLEYETRLNFMLPKYDDPVICTYDLSRFGAEVAMDIMRTHAVVIVGGVMQENPFFVPPDQMLLEVRERRAAGRPRA